LLRHNGPRAAEAPLGSPERVDEAAFLLGYDLPLEEPETYARLRDRLEPAAGEMGVRLIPVATNVRRTAFRRARWAYLSHGCVLAGVALALGGRWESALIASGETYANLQPRGSHPLTDPLLSTARTRIVHDGAGFSRVEKTDFLAGSEAVLGALRVCFKSRDEWNCGACNKCFRTMATLEAAGALDHCPTFPGGSFSLPRLRRLYSPDAAHARFMEDVAAYAERKGRPDIAGAVKESLRYSARLRRWLAPTARLKTRRGWRRLGRSLERLLMSGAIG